MNEEHYGPSWEAELMELPKETLINMIRTLHTKTHIHLLTDLQKELGYKEGELSTVAMLGLVGEAGEVLAETEFVTSEEAYVLCTSRAIHITKSIDNLKKKVRKNSTIFKSVLPREKEEAFDVELGDVFYYLNILATNRGLTISNLAQMAHDKVRNKMATPTGSSEERRDK